mgnify:CR=1 FL=1
MRHDRRERPRQCDFLGARASSRGTLRAIKGPAGSRRFQGDLANSNREGAEFDFEAAQRFAESLRKGGRVDRAVTISAEALGRFPEDRPLLTTYGLSQLTLGRAHEALRPLALVAQAEPQNWRVRSALGAALDQLGRFPEARAAYQEALTIEPSNARVMTNMGVSHIMAGEPEEAEPLLRQAADLRDAPPEARQNLAIALALQGKFAEAEQIERIDLPPQQAAANISYLRGLLSDPRRWGDVGRSR